MIGRLWRRLSTCTTARLWRLTQRIEPVYRTLAPRERRITRVNLTQAYPTLDREAHRRMVRESLTHSIATVMEFGFAWMAPPKRVEAAIKAVHGRELLDQARAGGRGVIVLAPHFGNWEVLNFWLSSHFPFTAMYEPPRIAPLDPVIRHGRERMGASLVPTTRPGRILPVEGLEAQRSHRHFARPGTRLGKRCIR